MSATLEDLQAKKNTKSSQILTAQRNLGSAMAVVSATEEALKNIPKTKQQSDPNSNAVEGFMNFVAGNGSGGVQITVSNPAYTKAKNTLDAAKAKAMGYNSQLATLQSSYDNIIEAITAVQYLATNSASEASQAAVSRRILGGANLTKGDLDKYVSAGSSPSIQDGDGGGFSHLFGKKDTDDLTDTDDSTGGRAPETPPAHTPKYKLVRGDGPNLGHDVLEGNGAAVYIVNERGEKFHIPGSVAEQMMTNGTWSTPTTISQKQVNDMAFKGALLGAGELDTINAKYRLVKGSGPNLGHDPTNGNGAAVYIVNQKGEKFHIPGAVAEQMIANGTWSNPAVLSQTQVDTMTSGAPITSLDGLNNPSLPALPVNPELPPEVAPPTVVTPTEPSPEQPESTPGTTEASGSYVRDTKDSGFAYPWSAAKSTGASDVMGTISKAVSFMNAQEGKNYKYDEVKGTITAADGSFISRDDVQALNNIIIKYSKTGFTLPNQEAAGTLATPSGMVANNSLFSSSTLDPNPGMARIEDSSNGLHTLDNPGLGGSIPGSDNGIKLP